MVWMCCELDGKPPHVIFRLSRHRVTQRSDDSGKLLIVDSQARGQQHLFFDDNIERDRAHIVDARDLETGRPLPFAGGRGGTQGRQLIKVEPWESILDLQYFVKALEAAEARIRSSRT